MDQFEEFKKHYVAAKVEYLKACARYDLFKNTHSAELDADEEDAVIRLKALQLAIQRRVAEVARIFRHMAKVVGDFDSIIDKDLRVAGIPGLHASALVGFCLDCHETGFICRVHIYIMRPSSYYAKLLKDIAKKRDYDLYFMLYNYVNSQQCNDAFELINELKDVDKKGAYVKQIIEYIPDNDVLNGDRGFLNRYIDDVIRKYYIKESANKHKG